MKQIQFIDGDEPEKIRPHSLLEEVEIYLSHYYGFRYNKITERIEYRKSENQPFQQFSKRDINSIYRALWNIGLKISITSLLSIIESDFTEEYHPFETYFNNLPKWDGVDYIAQLAETVKTTNQELWKRCLKKWIVAVVASATNPAIVNHTCIVLNGGQSIGKTTWAKNLMPPKLGTQYYHSGRIDPKEKDSLARISECLLINLDELEALTKKDMNSLKELITKPEVNFRRPYGYFTETKSHCASFIGSVNNPQFLTDITGNRRWLCFEAITINYNHATNMDKVFSQAKYLLDSNFQYWFDSSEVREVNRNNEQFQIVRMEEELLLKHFSFCKQGEHTHILTTTEVAQYILDNEKEGRLVLNHSFTQLIGKFLSKHNFHRCKKDGRYAYALKANK